MMLDVSHKTHYRYSQSVVQSQHRLHMSPRVTPRQQVRHHSLLVEPAPSARHDGIDSFGNVVTILDIEVPHREFVVHARSSVAVDPVDGVMLLQSTAWDDPRARGEGQDGALDLEVVQYRCASRLTPLSRAIDDYASVSFAAGRPVLDGAMDLTRRIFREFKFDPTATDLSTPIAQVLKARRGVCQDFAHLTLACLRARRIPARYVSGYLLTRPPPGQARLQGVDASHAWVSVWSPESGWVDFDPTNGLLVGTEHATIAFGRDYDDVSPICGVLIGGGAHTVEVGVDVTEHPAR